MFIFFAISFSLLLFFFCFTHSFMNFKRFPSFKKAKNEENALTLPHMIDKATLATNRSEDIVIFMKICKEINYEKKASKKAAEEISKRLKPKVEPQTQLLTISLLRTISENCKSFERRYIECIYVLFMRLKTSLLRGIEETGFSQQIFIFVASERLNKNNPKQLDAAELVEDPETKKLITGLQQTSPSESSRGYFKNIPLPHLKNAVSTDIKQKAPMRRDNHTQNTMSNNEMDLLIEEATNASKIVSELLRENVDESDELLKDLVMGCRNQHTIIMRQIWSIDDPEYLKLTTK
ncbi:hypothetical protein K501DRAFT_338431 [Backusella circina FSU 941]|nr:hypothetical protein K501DRAFT_338431 [Backusella circina FSU 941]